MFVPKVYQVVTSPVWHYYATNFLLRSRYFSGEFPVDKFEKRVEKISGVEQMSVDNAGFQVNADSPGLWEEIEPQIYAALKEAYDLPELVVVAKETSSA